VLPAGGDSFWHQKRAFWQSGGGNTRLVLDLIRRLLPVAHRQQEALAHEILDNLACDFGPLCDRSSAFAAMPDRHGVRVVVLPTDELPDQTIEAVLAWRLGQYLLAGFYDAEQAAQLRWRHEPRELVGPHDLHALAIDRHGSLLCYLTVKQPNQLQGRTWGDPDRPLYPVEEVHGRAWQRQLVGLHQSSTEQIWEWARFCKDQRRGRFDAAARRAPLELGLALLNLIQRPSLAGRWRIAVGDFDPGVALRVLRFFFVPAATFSAHFPCLPESHPLAPRYANHPTAPFVATTDDFDEATYLRWLDIDLALSFGDREAARRLLALRQVVSVKESRLKQPGVATDAGTYPLAALESASSHDASTALWAAAEDGRLPGWHAASLGPGELASTDRVVWVTDGYLQAFITRHEHNGHLGGVGPDVAHVPRPELPPVIALRAATPARVLVTDRVAFEDFWVRRQSCFETSTGSLYGEVPVEVEVNR
jgi:hypothetical protein